MLWHLKKPEDLLWYLVNLRVFYVLLGAIEASLAPQRPGGLLCHLQDLSDFSYIRICLLWHFEDMIVFHDTWKSCYAFMTPAGLLWHIRLVSAELRFLKNTLIRCNGIKVSFRNIQFSLIFLRKSSIPLEMSNLQVCCEFLELAKLANFCVNLQFGQIELTFFQESLILLCWNKIW